jgi:hypothetical protein
LAAVQTEGALAALARRQHSLSMNAKSRRALLPGVALVCALSFVAQVHWRPPQFALVAEIKTDAPARMQLRYNRGYGNRQEGLAQNVVAQTGEFVRVRFPIEVSSAHGLRLVNLGFGRSLDIRRLTLESLGSGARVYSPTQLAPNSPNTSETQITEIGDTIHVEWNGREPLVLHIEPGSRIPASRLAALLQWIFVIPLALAALSLVWISRKPADAWIGSLPRLRVVVIVTFIGVYLLASFANLNGSSTALWRYYADCELSTPGVLLGSPKEVRSDEWLIQTPWILSQVWRTPAFSFSNPSIGSNVTPLVTNLPVRHWSTWFRPQMWPFFLLSPERAFAFFWNFKTFGLLLSAFLFFGVLSGGRTLLDLAGALFLTFSPFIQWWLSTPTCLPEMLAMFFFGLWFVNVICRTEARWRITLAAIGLVVATENFIFCCYPRFQIPLAYLAGALALAIVVRPGKQNGLRHFRLWSAGLALAGIFLLTWQWWRDVAEVVRITSLLSYPGQIRFTGSDFEWRRFLDPFLEFSLTGDRFPERLLNASEAAGFLFVAPILAVCAIREAIHRRFDRMLVIPLLFIAFAVLYMSVGIPSWLSTVSGWSHVSAVRAQLLVGVATTVVLIRWLASGEERLASADNRWLIFGGCFLLFLPLLRLTNIELGHFESPTVVAATAIFFALVALCIWQRSATPACLLLVIPQFYACALVNPISHGVPAITESRMFQWLSTCREHKPQGNWLVLGDTFRADVLPELIKATGANVLGGIRCNPDYPMLRIVDPTGKYRALTDRYAWIHFRKGDADVPVIESGEGLAYHIKIPLRPEFLDQLNVKHVLEVDPPMNGEQIFGFHVVGIQEGCRLLERD